MFYVEYLVVKDVFHKPLRNLFRVKRLANGDAIVKMIVVTQNAPRTSL